VKRSATAVLVVAALWLATSCSEATSADPTANGATPEETASPTFTPAFIDPTPTTSPAPSFNAAPRATSPTQSQSNAPSGSDASASGTAAVPVPAPPAGLAGRVATLTIAAEAQAGTYDRDLFGGWIDADSDGCHSRCEVLEMERLAGGAWHSTYDGVSTTDPSSFDIDHMVPLAEAWRSGASNWDPARRVAFANDLAHPTSLIAVTASSNRSKGDRDPSVWMPPDQHYWCTYVDAWVSTKLTWGLAADPAEAAALSQHAASC